MGFNFVFLAGEYHVGLADALAANKLLGSPILRKEEAFQFRGNTVDIPKINFNVGMADNDASGTAGVTPGSDASDVISVAVRRLDGATEVESGGWEKHLGWASTTDRDTAMAKSFSRKAQVTILAGVMSKMAGVATDYTAMVKNITADSTVANRKLSTLAGKAARQVLIEAKGLHGAYDGEVTYLICHSDIVTVLRTLANDAGVPYYTENANKELVVEGCIVISCNQGTLASGTYSSYFVRNGALAFGHEAPEHYVEEGEIVSPDDFTGPIKVATIPTSADATEKYRFFLKSWYFAHVYSETDGADKVGISILKHLG